MMTTGNFMHVRAHLFEGQGGLIRILTDAERFGLSVTNIDLRAAAHDPALLLLSATFLAKAGELDAAQLAARLSRHPGVARVDCTERAVDPVELAAA
jgi:hypothetical protein